LVSKHNFFFLGLILLDKVNMGLFEFFFETKAYLYSENDRLVPQASAMAAAVENMEYTDHIKVRLMLPLLDVLTASSEK
jgi:hypothetical protein